MLKTEISADQIREALEFEYELRSYSGRGMYGKSCLGVNYEEMKDVLKIGFLLHQEMGDEALPLIQNARFDQMGRGYIMYFPAIAWEE
jgi:hypothetical protein